MNLDSSLFLTAPHSPSKWQSHCVRNELEQHLRSVCLTLILRTAIPSPPFMTRMWGVSWGIFYWCQVEMSGSEPSDCQVGLSQHADADSWTTLECRFCSGKYSDICPHHASGSTSLMNWTQAMLYVVSTRRKIWFDMSFKSIFKVKVV